MTISGKRLLTLGREMADRVDAEARAELDRASDIRDECERRRAMGLAAIWSDDRLWRRIPGGVQVLDTSQKALIQRAQRRSLELIDREERRLLAGLIPRAGRGPARAP